MVFNRNLAKKEDSNVTIQEIEQIENYINQIYLEKEAGTLFLLNNIEKTEEGYSVEIIEYVIDYSLMLQEEPENTIIIRNLNGEEVSRYSSSSQEDEVEIVKRNIDKFEKKKIQLKKENEQLYIEKEE